MEGNHRRSRIVISFGLINARAKVTIAESRQMPTGVPASFQQDEFLRPD
jgi:hypothetical protein